MTRYATFFISSPRRFSSARTGLAHRPAHTGLPMMTSRYSFSGFSVWKGSSGLVDVFMASMPQRI